MLLRVPVRAAAPVRGERPEDAGRDSRALLSTIRVARADGSCISEERPRRIPGVCAKSDRFSDRRGEVGYSRWGGLLLRDSAWSDDRHIWRYVGFRLARHGRWSDPVLARI